MSYVPACVRRAETRLSRSPAEASPPITNLTRRLATSHGRGEAMAQRSLALRPRSMYTHSAQRATISPFGTTLVTVPDLCSMFDRHDNPESHATMTPARPSPEEEA